MTPVYCIVQNFDEETDRFYAQLAIRQNIPFHYFLIVYQTQAL